VLLALAGCAQRGDFDRLDIQPDDMGLFGTIGKYNAMERGEPVSEFKLTEAERGLRRIGFRFLEPLGRPRLERDLVATVRWTRYGTPQRPLSDREGYYRALRDGTRMSGEAMWARLLTDLRDDRAMAGRFATTAQEVLRTDGERLALLRRGSGADGQTRADAMARIEENRNFVRLVTDAMDDRADVYQYAADQAALEAPSPQRYAVHLELPDYRDVAELISRLPSMYSLAGGRTVPRGGSAEPAEPKVLEAPLIDLSRS
jgi:hypothetical protein